jgi:hypothetical protein
LKSNGLLLERGDRLNQVSEGAAKPVKPPHHKGITGA